ncbi:MAG: hypothetical protein KAT65_02820 [Methanophagales archaeon]|nr:hypothetical protein [Methanophagales archaeon]
MNENSAIIGREIFDKDMSTSDEEIKRTLIAFEENAKVADSAREHYGGEFVAVYKQEIVGNNRNLERLLQEIDGHAIEHETYIGYIPKKEEIFLQICQI